jgi:hypothetical protein
MGWGMNWTKTTKYSWTSGDFTISANGMGGKTYRYTLYKGNRLLAVRDAANELKQIAEKG